MTVSAARVRWALGLGVIGIVLLGLFWGVRPPVGLAWLGFGLLPAILGFSALNLAGGRISRLWRPRGPRDPATTAALGLGLACVFIGAPSLFLTMWVLALVVFSLR